MKLRLLALSFALTQASCSEHDCTLIGTDCGQTVVTLEAPSDLWADGTYALTLETDVGSASCTLNLSTSDALDPMSSCSSPHVTFVATPAECATPCGSAACAQSPGDCVAGQYHVTVTLGDPNGPNPDATLATRGSIVLARDGVEIANASFTPKLTTGEPNGPGCGTCTNGAATVAVSTR
jgi:hypothetical protein